MKTFMNITNYRSKSSNPGLALPGTTSAMPVSTAAGHSTNPQRHSANGQSKCFRLSVSFQR